MSGEKLKILPWLSGGKFVLVSNRGPYVFKDSPSGVEKVKAVSGLVSSLEPLFKSKRGVWVAWSGKEAVEKSTEGMTDVLDGLRWREVPLSSSEIVEYYSGFANQVLWPLCHYFLEKCNLQSNYWNTYKKVNKKFAEITLPETAGAGLVWIHDYHLALVPGYLREQKEDLKLTFFWHIPFPNRDIFGILPGAKEILKGLLGSDLIGFHLPDYANNFLQCTSDLLGLDVDFSRGLVECEGRVIVVKAFPAGIDFFTFQKIAQQENILKESKLLKEKLKCEFLALAVDRLDYSKGILERLRALELFLERNPAYLNRFTFIQIAVPTRVGVPEYDRLKKDVEEMVGRINGRFSNQQWVPVHYYYRSFTREELVVYYGAADIALVTPLRDGLNLVAKEYVASKVNLKGVLILSHFAGAAEEMTEAVLVNPYSVDDLEEKIRFALEMNPVEQRRRLYLLQDKIRQYNSSWWLSSFLSAFPAEDLRHKAQFFSQGQVANLRIKD